MIGICAIASYLPSSCIDNLEQARRFGESADFIHSKIGALKLPVVDPSLEPSDAAALALKSLCEKSGLVLGDIDALVVVTQNPDGVGLPHTSAILHKKLGMNSRVAAFDVSLGCSGYVYGLSILRGVMEQAGLKNGVLITVDLYSRVVNREDRITSLLFGDAATATWLGVDAEWGFGRPLLETDGTGCDSLYVDSNHKLCMNGRQVFNFAAIRVPHQINRYLQYRELQQEDIDLYCLHQGSVAIINAISRRYPKVTDRFIQDMWHTGNSVSSSIPLLLEKYVIGKNLNRVLICGFGVGLSWATNVIERGS